MLTLLLVLVHFERLSFYSDHLCLVAGTVLASWNCNFVDVVIFLTHEATSSKFTITCRAVSPDLDIVIKRVDSLKSFGFLGRIWLIFVAFGVEFVLTGVSMVPPLGRGLGPSRI